MAISAKVKSVGVAGIVIVGWALAILPSSASERALDSRPSAASFTTNPPPQHLRTKPLDAEKLVRIDPGKGAIKGGTHLLRVDGSPAYVEIPESVSALASSPKAAAELAKPVDLRVPPEVAAELAKPIHRQRIVGPVIKVPLLELKAAAPSALIDFGREVHGRLQLFSMADSEIEVLVNLGESADEALTIPYTGSQWRRIPAHGDAEFPETGFRYVNIWFIKGKPNTKIPIDGFVLNSVYYPVETRGSFTSSDPVLNKVWSVGAYTAQLCMLDFVVDAPKRDRGLWAGDLLPICRVSDYVFADRYLVRASIDECLKRTRRPGATIPQRAVNEIPGYTSAWVQALADEYRFSGDREYLAARKAGLIQMLDFMWRDFDKTGLFVNSGKQWLFNDWSPGLFDAVQTPDQLAAAHMMIYAGFRDAAWMLRELGDPKAAEVEGWMAKMRQAANANLLDPATGVFGKRHQVNALAVFSGLASAQQAEAIFDKVLSQPYGPNDTVTPYGNYFVIQAMALAPNDRAAEIHQLIRDYWGSMLQRGATTWWENFDPRDKPDHIIPGIGPNWHILYALSLCHGWGAGPTAWLSRYALGVWPEKPGFSECEIAPRLGDLKWVEGDVPTPLGIIHVRHEKTGNGLRSEIKVPAGMAANIRLPILDGKAPGLRVNGKKMRGNKGLFRFP